MARDIPSPAVLALLARGVTATRLAKALGVGTPTVSRYLSGGYRAPQRLYGAIAALAGPDCADEVQALVAEARAQRDEQVPA